MLRFYCAVAHTAFRRQMIYRWANLAGLATNIFWGVIQSYVYIALFRARPHAAGYDVRDVLRYMWAVQAMVMIVLPFGWYDLMQTIRTGEVVSDLNKPCNFAWYWFSREAGRAGYFVIYRGLPIYLAGAIIFGFGVPGTWYSWLAFAVALPLGATLGIAYRFLYNISAFWLIEARSVAVLAGTIALFFTGSYVPLIFFPAWLHMLAIWLPFNGLMNIPAEIFLAKAQGGALLADIARQVLWLALLLSSVHLVTRRAARRVVAQGG